MKGKETRQGLRLVDSSGAESLSKEQKQRIDGALSAQGLKCPSYFTPEQRRAFYDVCLCLEEQQLLARSDIGVIIALAIARDALRETTAFLNENGHYGQDIVEGRPYKCPVCKGSGVAPGGPRAAARPPSPPQETERRTGRPCTVCKHEQRAVIDAYLLAGRPPADLSHEFRTVTRFALQRHLARGHASVAGGKGAEPHDVCRACKGAGLIAGRDRVVRFKWPQATDQRYAIEQITSLSAKLGLDNVSRAKIKGKTSGQPPKSGLEEYLNRRALRR